MNKKQAEKCEFDHLRGSCTKVKIAKPLLELLVVFEQFEDFEDAEDSE